MSPAADIGDLGLKLRLLYQRRYYCCDRPEQNIQQQINAAQAVKSRKQGDCTGYQHAERYADNLDYNADKKLLRILIQPPSALARECSLPSVASRAFELSSLRDISSLQMFPSTVGNIFMLRI